MPTTTFSIAGAPAIVWGGSYTDGFDGRPDRLLSNGSRFDGVVTGTDCVLGFYAYNNNFEWQVDGGSWTTYSGPQNTWATQALFSGLADAPHTLAIHAPNGYVYLDATSLLVVTGAAPAIATPAGMSLTTYLFGLYPNYFKADGSLTLQMIGFQPCLNNADGIFTDDGSVRFRGTLTGLQIFGYGTGILYRVAIDGVDSGSTYLSAPRSGTFDWVPLGTSYDGGAEHEYRISFGGSSGGNTGYLVGLMALGGTVNTTTTLPAQPMWAPVGDSITAGKDGTGNDNGLSWAHLISLAKGVGIRNDAHSGYSAYMNGATLAAAITGLPVVPDRVPILLGVNDAVAIQASTETVGQFQAAYQSMLQSILNFVGSNPVDCLVPLNTTNTAEAQRPAIKAAIIAAVAACTGTGAVRVIDTDGWIAPATADTVDGLHPSASGYVKIKTAYLATLAPARRRPRGGMMRLMAGSMSPI